MAGIFNKSIFNDAIFNTEAPGVILLGGGGDDKHYYADPYSRPRPKEVIQEEIIEVEDRLIDLRKQAQALRLKELAAQRAKDQREAIQLFQLQADLEQLYALIQYETQRLRMLDDEQTILVLMMAYPYLNLSLGGGYVNV